MPTYESEQRMARRRVQRMWQALLADPEVQAWRIAYRAEARKRRRRKFYLLPLPLHCAIQGQLKGGRARGQRRCTKRMGTRLCGNWRVNSTTRCHRHQLG